MQFASFYGGIVMIVCVLEIFAGFCILMRLFAMNIKTNLYEFNGAFAGAEEDLTAEDRIKLFKHLFEIIEFHSRAKELSYLFILLRI